MEYRDYIHKLLDLNPNNRTISMFQAKVKLSQHFKIINQSMKEDDEQSTTTLNTLSQVWTLLNNNQFKAFYEKASEREIRECQLINWDDIEKARKHIAEVYGKEVKGTDEDGQIAIPQRQPNTKTPRRPITSITNLTEKPRNSEHNQSRISMTTPTNTTGSSKSEANTTGIQAITDHAYRRQVLKFKVTQEEADGTKWINSETIMRKHETELMIYLKVLKRKHPKRLQTLIRHQPSIIEFIKDRNI